MSDARTARLLHLNCGSMIVSTGLAGEEAVGVLLVVGGTGELGRRIVRRLGERAVETRCLVRPGSDGGALRELGATVVAGDLTDPASLAAACQGVDTVIANATVISRRLADRGGPTIREVDEEGMASLIESAESAGVERFVYVSYAGIDDTTGTPLEQAKLATERRLERSTMRTAVLRPDAFQEVHLAPLGRFDIAAGEVAVFGRGDKRRRWVSTDDVAALAVAVALEPQPPATIEFGGPEALSRREAVAVARTLVDHPIKVRRVPLWVARLGIRLLNRRNDALASIFGTGLLQDIEATWDDAPLRARGIVPRPASDFLAEQARNVDRRA